MITLAQLEKQFNVHMFDYLARDAEVPTVTTAACQGDVSILRVTKRPATTPLPREGVAVVRGEAGGNTHSLHGEALWDPATSRGDGGLVLGVLTVPDDETAYLLHQEHGGMAILPGTYEIGRQREFAGEWRMVAD